MANGKGKLKRPAAVLLLLAAAAALLLPGGGLVVYQASGGETCTRCHEIRPSFDMWTNSSHRAIPCQDCHGGLLTPDLEFHAGNLRRVVKHARGEVPPQVLLARWQDIERTMEKCRSCHRQEYAAWQAGPHSATYADIFLDEEHNRKRVLMDDCFRCHGMHFHGSIRDLVEPVNSSGPWRLRLPEMASKPVIPCLACHEIHRRGAPLGPRDRTAVPAPAREEITFPSLALLDRRTEMHVPATVMPVPAMLDGERPVRMSPDRRQGLCYQCHAPRAEAQIGSGDDRTGAGVHEGLSCLACHEKHNQTTRASCANCHPQLSNCGLDVETMDTTFKDPASKHNIHWVKCADCHPKGVPAKKK
jgi:hypothetical protein